MSFIKKTILKLGWVVKIRFESSNRQRDLYLLNGQTIIDAMLPKQIKREWLLLVFEKYIYSKYFELYYNYCIDHLCEEENCQSEAKQTEQGKNLCMNHFKQQENSIQEQLNAQIIQLNKGGYYD